MLSHKFNNTVARPVLELLQSHSKFKVPRFQRNYAWDGEQVEILWADLTDNFRLIRDNPKDIWKHQYLLGSVVLLDAKDTDYFQIIDGQQRFATLTMLFCAARDIILEDMHKEGIPQPDGLGKIFEMIENTSMDKWDSWKLELNDVDRDFFTKILERMVNKETKIAEMRKKKLKLKSHKYLKEGYEILYNAITDALHSNFEKDVLDEVNNMGEDEKRKLRIKNYPSLFEFLAHVKENNYLIQVIVSDDSAAFQIFETLNGRGEELAQSDLIKNHILNKITGSQKEHIQREQSDEWNKIFVSLGAKQRTDAFIMDSYHSRFSDQISLRKKQKSKLSMSKKNLYKIVKSMVDNEKDCKQFISELKEDAEFLSTINYPLHYVDENSRDDVYSLKILNAKFIRIPMLAAYRKWYGSDKKQNYTALVKLLVKFFFKIRIVCKNHATAIENIMIKITGMINEDKPFDEIRKYIIKEDDHDNFNNDFEHRFMPSPNENAAKYALQQITVHLGTKHDDMKPVNNLTLEHILPSEYEKHWDVDEFFKGYDDDDIYDDTIDEFTDTLGNMTLLKQSINATLKNMSFDTKKNKRDKNGEYVGYMSSSLQINKKTVCNHDEWTAKIIVEREEEFARYADKIWKLD